MSLGLLSLVRARGPFKVGERMPRREAAKKSKKGDPQFHKISHIFVEKFRNIFMHKGRSCQMHYAWRACRKIHNGTHALPSCAYISYLGLIQTKEV